MSVAHLNPAEAAATRRDLKVRRRIGDALGRLPPHG